MAFGMNFFRKYQGRFLLVIAVFLMLTWFVGGALMKLFAPEKAAGTMFGERVTEPKYRQAVQVLETLRGEMPTDEEVWRFLVMQHEADRLGIKVTDEETLNGVRNWVRQLTQVPNERLDEAYRMVLTRRRTNDEWFRYAVSRDLRVNKLRSLVAGALVFSDAQAWQAYVEEYAQVKAKTLRVAVEGFEAQVPKPDDAALAAYYDANKATYLIPAKVTVEYAAALRSDFQKLFPVTEQEVSEYYEANKDEKYLKPISAPSTDSVTNPGSTDSAAAAPAPGSTPSDIASTTSVLSTDSAARIEKEYKPLSEVEGEIRAILMDRKAKGIIIDAHVDAVQQKATTLQTIAENYGLPCKTVGPISQAERDKLPGIADAATPDRSTVMEDIFNRKPGDYQSAEGPAGYFLYHVTSSELARQPAIEEIKDRLQADYVKSEAKKLAVADAARTLEELRTNGWGNYAKDPKYEVTEMPLASSGKLPDVFKAAVTLKEGEFGGPVSGPDGVYDFQVIHRTEPKANDFERDKALFRFYRFMGDRHKFVQQWQDDLYKSANVHSQMTAPGAARRESGAPLPMYSY